MQCKAIPRFAALVTTLVFVTGAAHAAQRTFVASTGLDTNVCSLTAPCRSFGAAIVNTNNGGDIVTLDSAGYGPVVIDKPVSIIVPAGVYAGVSVSGAAVDGIVVNVTGGTVLLRGLQISSQGGTNGVRIQQGNKVVLENVSISGFYASGNGKAILDASTSSFSILLLRNVVMRDGDSGLVVDGTTANKSVIMENSSIEGFGVSCVTQSDSVGMTVRDTVLAHCAIGFAVDQPATSFGYSQLSLIRSTMTSIGPGPAVKSTNLATDRAPNIAISDSHLFSTNGIRVTNGGNVFIDRSTIDGCGPLACLDASGTNGFANFEISKTELKHGGSGIRMVVDGTMGGVVNLVDSRVTNMYPNEGIYLRGNTNGYPNLVAKGNTINGNHKGIAVDSYAGAKLTGNQIVFNSAGGLFKVTGGTNQGLESSTDNYVTSNGWEVGSPPDAFPATVPLR